jgi:uncharacterized protein YfaS (alpha-2-macroglobulin family)
MCKRIVPIIFFLAATATHAATITRFTPQDEVSEIRQVVATFSEPMVRFGDPKAPSPFMVECSQTGAGRWINEKTFSYDFVSDLPAGVSCSFKVKPDFTSVKGETVSGKTQFRFTTGGPYVRDTRPYRDSANVDELQVFALTLSGAAQEQSVNDSAWCAIEGTADRIPLQIVTGEDRKVILQSIFGKRQTVSRAGEETQEAREARTLLVRCAQTAAPNAKITLNWGPGIKTLSGIATSKAQTLQYRVRDVFSASMTCQRENAQASCTPIAAIEVVLTNPIARKDAENFRLKTPDGLRKPQFDKGDTGAISRIVFPPPFSEEAELTLEVPNDLKDDSGRSLSNATLFPLKFRTAAAPPLAKFSSGVFGVVELNADPALPVTLRRIELPSHSPPAVVRQLKVNDDAAIMKWLLTLSARHSTDAPSETSARDTRNKSLLRNVPGITTVSLPAPKSESTNGLYPFEVVGLPFKAAGFYVSELESSKLGSALLGKPTPMFVRTSSLVSNLAVHLKIGRENSSVWVTTLDKAKTVPNAAINITDCTGKQVWKGVTDSNGVAAVPLRLEAPLCSPPRDAEYSDYENPRYLVSARSKDDMAFVLSTWNQGIETYRFNLPTAYDRDKKIRGHAVLDRTLLRAGETVSFKVYARTETLKGLALLPADALPKEVKITHVGSNQEFMVPLSWNGARFATGQFPIAKEAKLGQYRLSVRISSNTAKKPAATEEAEDFDSNGSLDLGGFRIEEFRLPSMAGRIQPITKATVVAAKELPVSVQLDYLSGGPAAGHAVQISAMQTPKFLSFEAYESFSFSPPEPEDAERAPHQQLITNKQPLLLDKNGTGTITLKELPKLPQPANLVLEATYADGNGEIQTLSNTVNLWPSSVIVGINMQSWVSVDKALSGQVLVLDTSGKPLAGKSIEVTATSRSTSSYRKRLVGGFYAYENQKESKLIGKVCSGKTDARGLVFCNIKLDEPGNIELVATVRDEASNFAQAGTSVWVTKKGELWFEGENHDRMELLPEKRHYSPGETAKFQVRMPFRYATALISIEREGIVETKVVRLSGQDPTIEVPVKPEYGPNVYVSVLAVRERLREVPWYSIFTWGWKEPFTWWKEYREYQAPGSMVDLTKPAYKLGIAEISVGLQANELKVEVTPDKPSYAVRGTSMVKVKVRLPNGKPLPAGTPVTFAAVDLALLELSSNDSWKLLEAMMARRQYGVDTYTAQMYVVGKRHFGRKAVAPGGGGGKGGPTRELFDTLLAWNPNVLLDANGEATLRVPLNDSLSTFTLVAIADAEVGGNYALFGTGQASIKTTQDLQIVNGLPPLVRDGDSYQAGVTVRNTTARAMEVEVTAKMANQPDLAAQRIKLAANAASEVRWTVTPPAETLAQWEIAARELAAPNAADRIRITQKIAPSVPVTVQQATLLQLDKPVTMPVVVPADSLPGKARLEVGLSASLAKPMPGVRRYFEQYPFICLEQKASKAIGLRDPTLWKAVATQLPLYLDSDGLAMYFPARPGEDARGSDVLTSYLLAATQESGYEIPEDALNRMQIALAGFVEGKIKREFWSPAKDMDVRKLVAIEALSRRGKAQAKMLDSLRINPNLWPTHAVIDWLAILHRVPEIAGKEKKLEEVNQVLRSRLNMQGTRLGFSTETNDYWWWMMASGDANASKLILAVLNDPAWKDDMGRLVNGTLQRQIKGAWLTTTANVWGSLAMEKFAAKFESLAVTGNTKAELSEAGAQTYAWKAGTEARLSFPFADKPGANSNLRIIHEGTGTPWATISSLAAIRLKEPFSSGYRITKTFTPIEPKVAGKLSRGDTVRVRLQIDAQTDMTWVVLSDPIPSGATILGSGLGRDSQISTKDEKSEGRVWPAYEERAFEGLRSYYEYVPKGQFVVEYTIRLNSTGEFQIPQTRVEAMYAPEMFGETPNPKILVQ